MAAQYPRCGLCGRTHAVKRFYLSHFYSPPFSFLFNPKIPGRPLRKAAARRNLHSAGLLPSLRQSGSKLPDYTNTHHSLIAFSFPGGSKSHPAHFPNLSGCKRISSLLLFVMLAMFISVAARIAEIWPIIFGIFICSSATRFTDAHTPHITVRIVDRVLDIAVVEIIHHLFHRHNGAVILRLFPWKRPRCGDHDGMPIAAVFTFGKSVCSV